MPSVHHLLETLKSSLWRALPMLAAVAIATTNTTAETTQPPATNAPDTSYVLRPNDSVRLTVFQEPDLSVQVRILQSGEASFPLIGSVKLAGLSIEQATREITKLYAADYLVDPNVNLTIDDYAVQFVSIIGSVRNPGQIPMPVSGNLDLAAVMATAGGLTEDADPNSIQLVRADGPTSTFSINAIQGAAGKTAVKAGDRIIANQSRFVGQTFTVMGQVRKPGPHPFPLDGKLDLVAAIAFAGGLTDLARPNRMSVNRRGQNIDVDFREISRSSERPFAILPGDVINVPERLF
jgi:polysaccharide export outer membrane protein